ncbi:MAG TPA: glycosyltransferase family 39 protein, partial [Planctomycetota bacterium]|nr:glycosyltransferase family 39 protein [Planctomycetota bacterium]
MSRTADSPAARPAAAPLRDGVVLALLAFAVGRLLAQDTFYGPDGRMLIKMTMSGLVAHPLHWFAPQFLRASHAAIAWTGGSWYEAGLLLSQVGFAFAAFAWHRAAAVLGVPRGRAAVVVALCATAPAILFFTSVVELHAPFLAFAAGACWAAARLATRPTPGAGVLFGVVTGVALGAHATAHLLVPWLLIFAWLRAPRGAARFLPWLGAVAAHVAVSVALPVALRAAGAAIEAGGAGSYLLFEARGRRLLAALPAQTWTDWL